MTADLPIHPNEGDSFEVGAYYRSAFGDIYQVLTAPISIGPTDYIVVAWVEYQEGYLARLSEGGGGLRATIYRDHDSGWDEFLWIKKTGVEE